MTSKLDSLSPEHWEQLPDEALLQLRIRHLGLSVERPPLKERIGKLYSELEAKGILFHPKCYLADEWLCPDKAPIVGIPFFLAHPKLTTLEKKMMLEAEGDTESEFMKLLRHEMGHAINYAYRIFQRPKWRELFGLFTKPYYDVSYYSRPYSRRYVTHLRDNYAQAHPDEDFAETFAVWLTPDLDWKSAYRGWPALKKLEFVDKIMVELRGKPPLVKVNSKEGPWSASRMSSTLEHFYIRKRLYLKEEFPGYFDASLQKIFSGLENDLSAGRFLRKHRKHMLESVARWLPQRKYDIDKFLRKLITRSDALSLRLHRSEPDTMVDAAMFVASVMGSMRSFNGVHEGR